MPEKHLDAKRKTKGFHDVTTQKILPPEPNALWVSTNIPVDIQIAPGKVPKTFDELMHFSECLNDFFIEKGAQWAKYTLFDEHAQPVASLDCDF